MNKAELIAHLAARGETTKAEARRLLDIVLDAVTDTLRSGEPVHLSGFGNFDLRVKGARTGSVAGRAFDRPARSVVRFRASPAVTDSLPAPSVAAE